MKLTTIPRVIRPRNERGIDWGAERIVLIRSPVFELWWRHGHTAWVSRGASGYYAARLLLIDRADRHQCTRTLQEGGRLTATMLWTHSDRLREAFGYPFTREELAQCASRKSFTLEIKP